MSRRALTHCTCLSVPVQPCVGAYAIDTGGRGAGQQTTSRLSGHCVRDAEIPQQAQEEEKCKQRQRRGHPHAQREQGLRRQHRHHRLRQRTEAPRTCVRVLWYHYTHSNVYTHVVACNLWLTGRGGSFFCMIVCAYQCPCPVRYFPNAVESAAEHSVVTGRGCDAWGCAGPDERTRVDHLDAVVRTTDREVCGIICCWRWGGVSYEASLQGGC